MEIRKLDLDEVRDSLRGPLWEGRDIGPLQVAVYVMVGGGMLGRMAAQQPADFYLDARVSRRPYSTKAILNAVEVLAAMAEEKGLNPHNLPAVPQFHACGVF